MRIFLLSTFVILTSCGTFDSVPFKEHAKILDKKSVEFIRNTPHVNLNNYANQQDRIRLRKGKKLDKDIMVAVSGGGARAAAFTLGVLAELEKLGELVGKDKSNALDEIDYFSTVSGGGWAVGAYLANRHFSQDTPYSLNKNIKRVHSRFQQMEGSQSYCQADKVKNLISKNELMPCEESFDCSSNTYLAYKDIFPEKNSIPTLPYIFSNATIHSNHAPFTFTQANLDYYKIKTFNFCDEEIDAKPGKTLANLDLSGPLAISSSVPGFYSAFADTGICDKSHTTGEGKRIKKNIYWDSYYCKTLINDDPDDNDNALTRLILIDGGLYDNYGFFTALEALDSLKRKKDRVLIVIDSNADTNIPFQNTTPPLFGELGIIFSTATKSVFPSRTTQFRRNYKNMANHIGVESFVLDFFSATEISEKLKNNPSLLDELDSLKKHVKKEIYCYDFEGNTLYKTKKEKTSTDCLENNFYRAGLLHKTTYKYSESYFKTREELGRLVVRLNAQKLYDLIYKPNPPTKY